MDSSSFSPHVVRQQGLDPRILNPICEIRDPMATDVPFGHRLEHLILRVSRAPDDDRPRDGSEGRPEGRMILAF